MTTSTKPASSTFDKTLIYIFASGILLLILDAVIQFDPAVLVFAVLSLAGSFVCVLIIMYNMQKDNPLTRKLCQNIGAFDCNKVLHSPAAQIFKGVNLGDIGLIYFLAQFLFLSFGKYGAFNTLLLLSIPSFLAWCATFWSIWYQWKVVKSWCKMCLLTTAVIWLQAGTFFYSLKNICIDCTLFNSTSLPGAGLLITCSLLACTWLLIKPIIGKAEELTTARQQLRQWKRHTSVFNALLKKQAAIDAAVWENDFLLGNPEGAVIWMMVVVNPFCPACALEYKLLSSLIQTYPGSICLIVRFGINYNNRVAEQTLAVQELIGSNLWIGKPGGKNIVRLRFNILSYYRNIKTGVFPRRSPVRLNYISMVINSPRCTTRKTFARSYHDSLRAESLSQPIHRGYNGFSHPAPARIPR